MLRRTAIISIGSVLSGHALASDYAREQRFSQEVQAQLVVGDAVQIPNTVQPSLPNFLGLWAAAPAAPASPGTPATSTRPAVVLAHGVGLHPDAGITGDLRKLLSDMGYPTLAIQMPIGSKEAAIEDYFPKLFPEAGSRLESAAQWLAARGHSKVLLVSHTMGSWMANVHFDQTHRRSAYKAWVCISLTGGYSNAVRDYSFPVLDLYGEQDIGVTVSSAWRRAGLLRLAAAGSGQVKIEGADVEWRGKQGAAAAAIDAFAKRVLSE
jgi:hypothetical protein